MYDAQGIQQQGRIFEVAKEVRVEPCEHRQGKIGKNQSWKHAFNCQNCGKRAAGRSDGANRFCRNECHQEFQVNRWLACSCCLAKIGLGQQTAGKIIGVHGTSIGRQWKARGVVAEKPKCGSMVYVGRAMITAKRKEAEAVESEPQRLYEEAAMADIRAHRRFFDWSAMWMNKQAMDEYNSPENIYERCCMRSIRAHGFKSVYPDWSQVWARSRMSMSPAQRAVANMRTRLKLLMKTARRGGASVKSSFIGCSTSQLAKHLESKFKRGMTWDNYGTHWHVDHVIPCASFDHTDSNHVARCWHWTNLEPLEASANIAKRDAITKPQMQLLLCATH